MATNRPADVGAVVLGAGQSKAVLGEVLGALASPAPPPVSLAMIPDLPAKLIGPILGAVAKASTASWKSVWVAIACIVLANAVACCFLKPVSARMNLHVESALENHVVRDQQLNKGKAGDIAL